MEGYSPLTLISGLGGDAESALMRSAVLALWMVFISPCFRLARRMAGDGHEIEPIHLGMAIRYELMEYGADVVYLEQIYQHLISCDMSEETIANMPDGMRYLLEHVMEMIPFTTELATYDVSTINEVIFGALQEEYADNNYDEEVAVDSVTMAEIADRWESSGASESSGQEGYLFQSLIAFSSSLCNHEQAAASAEASEVSQ